MPGQKWEIKKKMRQKAFCILKNTKMYGSIKNNYRQEVYGDTCLYQAGGSKCTAQC